MLSSSTFEMSSGYERDTYQAEPVPWEPGTVTGTVTLPEQMAIPRAHEAFTPERALKEPRQQQAITALGRTLAAILVKLHG